MAQFEQDLKIISLSPLATEHVFNKMRPHGPLEGLQLSITMSQWRGFMCHKGEKDSFPDFVFLA